MGFTDFKSAGVHPSVCAEGSTPLHSRQISVVPSALMAFGDYLEYANGSRIGTCDTQLLATQILKFLEWR